VIVIMPGSAISLILAPLVAANPVTADDADTNLCRKMVKIPASFHGAG
jgi:hypothetical protein